MGIGDTLRAAREANRNCIEDDHVFCLWEDKEGRDEFAKIHKTYKNGRMKRKGYCFLSFWNCGYWFSNCSNCRLIN